MTKVSIYARVSTDRQETENQIIELKELIQRKGWELGRIYKDHATRGSDTRPQLEKALQDAHEHRYDVLLFWSIDRLTRKGYDDAHRILRRLIDSEVDFFSLKEQYIQTMGPFRDIIIHFISDMAKLETDRMSERIKAGLKRAKKEGKKLGRPRTKVRPNQVAELREKGLSFNEIGKELDISSTTAFRLLQNHSLENDTTIKKED